MSEYEQIALDYQRPADQAAMLEQADSFYKTMAKRRTVRDFSADPVDRGIIEAAIAAAGTAPSGANKQPWHFVAISDDTIKFKIREAAEAEEREFYERRATDSWLADLAPLGTDANKPFLQTAPWLIAIFAERIEVDDKGEKHKNYYVPESVGLASGLLIASLHKAGLATLTHTPSPMGFLNEICERPLNEKPFILLVVGYPADDATVPAISRKPLTQIRDRKSVV